MTIKRIWIEAAPALAFCSNIQCKKLIPLGTPALDHSKNNVNTGYWCYKCAMKYWGMYPSDWPEPEPVVEEKYVPENKPKNYLKQKAAHGLGIICTGCKKVYPALDWEDVKWIYNGCGATLACTGSKFKLEPNWPDGVEPDLTKVIVTYKSICPECGLMHGYDVAKGGTYSCESGLNCGHLIALDPPVISTYELDEVDSYGNPYRSQCLKCNKRYSYPGNSTYACEICPGPNIMLVTLDNMVKSSGTKAITIISFSYKNGVPEGTNKVFDVRTKVRNPWKDADLRPLTGMDKKVQDFVAGCKGGQKMLSFLRSAYKSQWVVAVGCMGGKHRSVALAEMAAKHYRDKGWEVTVVHRDLKVKDVTD